jgi:hypothetical protein
MTRKTADGQMLIAGRARSRATRGVGADAANHYAVAFKAFDNRLSFSLQIEQSVFAFRDAHGLIDGRERVFVMARRIDLSVERKDDCIAVGPHGKCRGVSYRRDQHAGIGAMASG